MGSGLSELHDQSCVCCQKPITWGCSGVDWSQGCLINPPGRPDGNFQGRGGKPSLSLDQTESSWLGICTPQRNCSTFCSSRRVSQRSCAKANGRKAEAPRQGVPLPQTRSNPGAQAAHQPDPQYLWGSHVPQHMNRGSSARKTSPMSKGRRRPSGDGASSPEHSHTGLAQHLWPTST